MHQKQYTKQHISESCWLSDTLGIFHEELGRFLMHMHFAKRGMRPVMLSSSMKISVGTLRVKDAIQVISTCR
jgi:hypothetical protein